MDKIITVYHGSQNIIETPALGQGKKNNDFGLGFYCTQINELAKEWAVTSMNDGFSNKYTLDTEYLNVLKLNSPEFTILNWIAVLIEHRVFATKNPIVNRAKKYLSENFSLNVNFYDIITGFRADDSYFDYAEAFLNNSITVEQLSYAMHLGKLGEQIVLKSEYAFSKIKFEGFETAEKDIYFSRRKTRNDVANKLYFELLKEEQDGLFIQDIIRGAIKNDDPRIPRNICE